MQCKAAFLPLPRSHRHRFAENSAYSNENINEFQNILFSVLFGDIGKGIVVHGLAEINGIEHLDSIRLIG